MIFNIFATYTLMTGLSARLKKKTREAKYCSQLKSFRQAVAGGLRANIMHTSSMYSLPVAPVSSLIPTNLPSMKCSVSINPWKFLMAYGAVTMAATRALKMAAVITSLRFAH